MTGRSLINVTGNRFGRLVAIRRHHIKNKKAYWLCKCDCGREHIANVAHLRNGDTKSCGCLHRSQNGLSGTRTYKSWSCMVRRCSINTSNRWKHYGGKGVTVCDRWKSSYSNFLEDMGERPDGKTLDRIDTGGDYCKENCRWLTPKEQGRNKKNNKLVTHNNKTATLAEWQEITGIDADTLSWRLKSGWTDEEALTLQVSPMSRSVKKTTDCRRDPV